MLNLKTWASAMLVLSVLAGCAHAPAPPPTPSHAVEPLAAGALARLAAAQGVSPTGGVPAAREAAPSAVHLLGRGLDALAARKALIDSAERSIDLQYYIWRPDTSGTGLAVALWQAAERGVRVRMLLDDWGARPSEEALGLLAVHPNIEVRLFNPLALRWSLPLALLLDFERGNRRMHNKLLVADNQAMILGGRNVADEYFERRAELDFGDLDALVLGPAVRQASAGFDAYWNSATVRPVTTTGSAAQVPQVPLADLWAQVADTGLAQRLADGGLRFTRASAVALQDDPAKAEGDAAAGANHLGRRIGAVMGEATQSLLLVSPYFVPGAGGVAQLVELRRRGVAVRIITNSLAATDVPAVHAGYKRWRRDLVQAGVELFEIRADASGVRRASGRSGGLAGSGSSRLSLHAKVLVVDGRSVFVGSMNIDPRSLQLNTENGLVVTSADLASRLAVGIDAEMERAAWRVELHDGALRWRGRGDDGREVLHMSEPLAGWWLRTQAAVWSLLPIDSLL